MKPIFKYPGGKTRELKNIREWYPSENEETIFVEPFLGGGAVYWDFPDAKEYHVNDISEDLINIYKNSKSKNEKFIKVITDISDDWDNINNNEYSLAIQYDEIKYKWFYDRKIKKMDEGEAQETAKRSAYFVKIRELFNNEKNKNLRSAYYLFVMTFAFSSLFQYNSKGELNIPYGGKGYNNKSFSNVVKRILSNEVQSKLKKTKFYCEDFETFLNRFINEKKSFVFLDPPYVSDMIYNGTVFNIDQQIRLVKVTSKLNNFLTVIGDDKEIYKMYNEVKNFTIKKSPIKFSINFKGRNDTDKYNLYISRK